MSLRCPAGHETTSADYCDVCGLPVAGATPESAGAPSPAAVVAGASGGAAGAAVLPPPLPGAPAPSGKGCPHCGTDNLPDALFCENCGYDFTTGAAPFEEEPAASSAPEAGEVPDADVVLAAPVEATPDAAAVEAPDEVPDAAPDPVPPAVAGPPSPAPSVDPSWVAEVWVDPDWYAAQGSTDPCPSAGPPAVVVLGERSVLIGRTSATRNIHPQIDISTDPGVSRRHAQLSTDGRRWFVEDLASANGTFVGTAGAPLPDDPLDPGVRVELDDDDRLYLGAWTRIVLRPATADELA